MVKSEDTQLSGCGFESRRRILDGVCEASYYIGKKIKVAKWGTQKIFKKKKKKKKKTISSRVFEKILIKI